MRNFWNLSIAPQCYLHKNRHGRDLRSAPQLDPPKCRTIHCRKFTILTVVVFHCVTCFWYVLFWAYSYHWCILDLWFFFFFFFFFWLTRYFSHLTAFLFFLYRNIYLNHIIFQNGVDNFEIDFFVLAFILSLFCVFVIVDFNCKGGATFISLLLLAASPPSCVLFECVCCSDGNKIELNWWNSKHAQFQLRVQFLLVDIVHEYSLSCWINEPFSYGKRLHGYP